MSSMRDLILAVNSKPNQIIDTNKDAKVFISRCPECLSLLVNKVMM